jgi:hypothetical protein
MKLLDWWNKFDGSSTGIFSRSVSQMFGRMQMLRSTEVLSSFSAARKSLFELDWQ